jgi:hypothetical protein
MMRTTRLALLLFAMAVLAPGCRTKSGAPSYPPPVVKTSVIAISADNMITVDGQPTKPDKLVHDMKMLAIHPNSTIHVRPHPDSDKPITIRVLYMLSRGNYETIVYEGKD